MFATKRPVPSATSIGRPGAFCVHSNTLKSFGAEPSRLKVNVPAFESGLKTHSEISPGNLNRKALHQVSVRAQLMTSFSDIGGRTTGSSLHLIPIVLRPSMEPPPPHTGQVILRSAPALMAPKFQQIHSHPTAAPGRFRSGYTLTPLLQATDCYGSVLAGCKRPQPRSRSNVRCPARLS